ncbi:hypothetical protein GGI42DRAFT_148375 [Trichoderma sp. SZMC 28013]
MLVWPRMHQEELHKLAGREIAGDRLTIPPASSHRRLINQQLSRAHGDRGCLVAFTFLGMWVETNGSIKGTAQDNLVEKAKALVRWCGCCVASLGFVCRQSKRFAMACARSLPLQSKRDIRPSSTGKQAQTARARVINKWLEYEESDKSAAALFGDTSCPDLAPCIGPCRISSTASANATHLE